MINNNVYYIHFEIAFNLIGSQQGDSFPNLPAMTLNLPAMALNLPAMTLNHLFFFANQERALT